ncbi:MAG TPA: ion transporter [Vitreimonas sp.]|nr:ion transporter [Vitreimonas sp.]
MTDPRPERDVQLEDERWQLLRRIDRVTDRPMIALSIVWIVLLIVDLLGGGLPPLLDAATYAIWALFAADFAVGMIIAPDRRAYLRTHWLVALSLVLPALRILRLAAAARFLRAGRAVRSVSMLRMVTSLNRGMNAVGRALGRRGVGYLLALTALVIPVGAAGMTNFEGGAGAGPTMEPLFSTYGDALWWTAMTMTTGAATEPQSGEGRLLAWVLLLYGLGVFGYLTAVLASHFVGRERGDVTR